MADEKKYQCECQECRFLRARNEPTHHQHYELWGCEECGCTDIEVTAWLHYNTRDEIGCDPPLDDVWCPQCHCDVGRTKEVDVLKPYVDPDAEPMIPDEQLPIEAVDPIDRARFK